jgi:hypothetical protein
MNLNLGNFSGSTLLFVPCAGDRCGMAGGDEDRGRNRRLGAEDRGCSSTGVVLDGRTIEGLSDAICGLHHAHRQGARVSGFSHKTKVNDFSRFGLKTGGYGYCGLVSKPLARVS